MRGGASGGSIPVPGVILFTAQNYKNNRVVMNMNQQLLVGHAGRAEHSIQKQAFQTNSVYFSSQDAQLSGAAYDIEVHQLNLPSAGRGVYYSASHCFLEYVELPDHSLSARYPGTRDRHRPIGQLIFIPPGVELEWQWGKGVQRAVTCMFEVERIAHCGAQQWRWDNVNLANTFNIKNDYLLTGMRKLGEEACAPGFASDLQIESLLAVMGIELYRQFIGRQSPVETSSQRLSTRQLQRVREFVHANLNEALTISSIAGHCDLSPRELSRQLKDSMGTTLRQFVANARIDEAKRLLANRQLMIKQVGYQCGFKGAAAFVAAFRKATGKTPAEYRQQYC